MILSLRVRFVQCHRKSDWRRWKSDLHDGRGRAALRRGIPKLADFSTGIPHLSANKTQSMIFLVRDQITSSPLVSLWAHLGCDQWRNRWGFLSTTWEFLPTKRAMRHDVMISQNSALQRRAPRPSAIIGLFLI